MFFSACIGLTIQNLKFKLYKTNWAKGPSPSKGPNSIHEKRVVDRQRIEMFGSAQNPKFEFKLYKIIWPYRVVQEPNASKLALARICSFKRVAHEFVHKNIKPKGSARIRLLY